MTTAISDPFTYPVDKAATDADHAPLGVALAQALEDVGLTKVSGPTTLGEWELAALAGDATMIWDFEDVIDGEPAHLYVRFILRTGALVDPADTGWEVTASKYENFTVPTISANWFAGASAHIRPDARYFISFSESCLVGHVDYPLPTDPPGQSQVAPNGFCVERSRAGTTPDDRSVALFVVARTSENHVFKVMTTDLLESTYSETSPSVQFPIGDPVGNGKMLVSPIGWFDHSGTRRTLNGVVLLPSAVGSQQLLPVTNSGVVRTYMTPRNLSTHNWAASGVGSTWVPMTAALRWE
jgi:hypothetical protein